MKTIFERSFLGHSPLGFHRVAYTEWGAHHARPPVICVHGLTRNGRDFDRLASVLQAEAQIYCPDIVGRGKSDYLADPKLYNYPQYLADMNALIARTGAPQIDWVGTSMGGIIGMLLAAGANSPIRRLVINDVGPFVPLAALRRIADYAGMKIEFADMAQFERHMRANYAPFGITRDEDWKHMAQHSAKTLPNGKLAFAYDLGIAENFRGLDKDVDFWNVFEQIKCPILLIRGSKSDVLTHEVAQKMSEHSHTKLVEFEGIGHAPALLDDVQIAVIQEFLRG